MNKLYKDLEVREENERQVDSIVTVMKKQEKVNYITNHDPDRYSLGEYDDENDPTLSDFDEEDGERLFKMDDLEDNWGDRD